ncbi:MAG TPA: hypothetical protein VHK06_03030, partial [Candidatus Limnocylindria bacterium]|nr:hypothetical protein [Candidatus Limnocylindria bacterium]
MPAIGGRRRPFPLAVRLLVLLALLATSAAATPARASDPIEPIRDGLEEIERGRRDPSKRATPRTQSDASLQTEGAPSTEATVQAAAAPTTWNVAMVIYRGTNTTCNGQTVQHRLADYDIERAQNAAAYFGRQVFEYSEGYGNVSITYDVRETLTSVTDYGEGCWPFSHDVEASGGFPRGFDSVHVQYPAEGLNPWYGLGVV